MKARFAAVLVVLLIGCAAASAAELEGADPAALESKLIGTWKGEGPCTGVITFRADRTYERKRHGPGGNNSAGVWMMRWDALPPTLVLICKTSEDPTFVRREEVKVTQLDGNALVFTYPSSKTSTLYAREKK